MIKQPSSAVSPKAAFLGVSLTLLTAWMICWGIGLLWSPLTALCNPWMYTLLPAVLLWLGSLDALLREIRRTKGEDPLEDHPDALLFRMLLTPMVLLTLFIAVDELFGHTVPGQVLVGLARLGALGLLGLTLWKLIRGFQSREKEPAAFTQELLWEMTRSALTVLFCLLLLLPFGDGEKLENWALRNGYTGDIAPLNANLASFVETMNEDSTDHWQILVEQSSASPAGSMTGYALQRNGQTVVSVTRFHPCSTLHRWAAGLTAKGMLSDPQTDWTLLAEDSGYLYHTVTGEDEQWLLSDGYSDLLTFRFPGGLSQEQRDTLLNWMGAGAR